MYYVERDSFDTQLPRNDWLLVLNDFVMDWEDQETTLFTILIDNKFKPSLS